MRSALLFLSVALIFGALGMLLGQSAGVGAVGAPTDNYTIPNIPTNDESQEEIEPINYVLQGPTTQSETTQPNVVAVFVGPSEQDNFRVTGNESWYLDVDINMPGWLYISEYVPVGESFQGEWIAYKWEVLESGLWRLGPFTAADNEPEGQHVYRIWFYGDGQWAAEDPSDPQENLVYWTYSKGLPAEQTIEEKIPPQPPIAPAKEATFLDEARQFITKPIALVFSSVILVVIAVLGVYLYRRYARRGRTRGAISPPAEVEAEESPVELQPATASAKVALPNGIEVQFAGDSKVMGRGDLARALSLDELGLISRRHFEVRCDGELFYIEDLDSANGTRLNGVDISGKGPVSLNDNDVIEPAGAIRVTFYLL